MESRHRRVAVTGGHAALIPSIGYDGEWPLKRSRADFNERSFFLSLHLIAA